MPTRKSDSDVTEVTVEIDGPTDRAAKEDQLRSNSGSVSITGSGGSSGIVTNNSSGNWYLDGCYVTAEGTSLALGAVKVVVEVRDSNDDVVTSFSLDPAVGNYLPCQGHIVKPGQDVHALVTQQDANSYTINVDPLFRKPDPSSGQEKGGGSKDVPTTVYEDWERSSPLSDYSGDSGEFGTVTSNPYYNGTALAYNTSTTSTAHTIVSTSGLSEYPSDPFTVRTAIRSDVTYGGSSTDFVSLVVGAADTNNYLEVRYKPGAADLELVEDSPGSNQLGFEGNAGRYQDSADWWFLEADYDGDRGNEFVGRVLDEDRNTQFELEGSATLKGDGIGFRAQKASSGDDHFIDYAREVA